MKTRYELTVVFSPELSSQELTKAVKKLKTLIEKHEGKLVKDDDWGVRDFCYAIKKHSKGAYRFFVVEIPGSAIIVLDKELKLNEEILRYLFVKTEK